MVLQNTVKLRGYKPYSMTNQETGQVFTGQKLFISFSEPDVTGESVDTQNVSSDVLKGVNLSVGASYALSYESKTYNGDTRLKVVAIKLLSLNK